MLENGDNVPWGITTWTLVRPCILKLDASQTGFQHVALLGFDWMLNQCSWTSYSTSCSQFKVSRISWFERVNLNPNTLKGSGTVETVETMAKFKIISSHTMNKFGALMPSRLKTPNFCLISSRWILIFFRWQ